ncbi:DUF4876 domain-containing protein [uncultured Prevotella sp.]|uniref:DUF4876 domain-containing protein n=1 Tax=uncultured Prevotella sp. TaxID=159272 RepID=UPI0026118CEA|nr:DUF4876 domain-containing protein [uncultured Prevotella sp.]
MKTFRLFMILLCVTAIASCSSDDGSSVDTTPTDLKIMFQLPDGYADDATLTDLSLTLTDINTQRKTTFNGNAAEDLSITLKAVPGGYYRIDATGKLNYRNKDLVGKQVDVLAYSEGIILTREAPIAALKLQVTSQPEADPADIAYRGFVLGEIFCAGTANRQGNYYYADKYFVIYNNTDHVLYADSLVIAESDFLTTMKQEYTPDIMPTDMAVSAMYMIPGSGHDVPVQPGGKLLVVDNAVNHTVANPNSWDMTKADYEWYDESTNPQFTDIDNPNVPNLERIYSSTLTLWSPHSQGFKSYALARMHADRKTFLTDYMYDYTYHLVGQIGEADMTGSAYRLSNSWILDAVNMSVPALFQWIVTSPTLDKGYTYCADFGWDDSRYGKSVRRKVKAMDGTRAILQDTNNSTDDFEPRTKADPFHVFGK